MNLEASLVKNCAVGYWPGIIKSLAPQLIPTIEREGKHGPCDLCGGKDRSRRHNDFQETGGIICGQCEGASDGLGVLVWANGWSFREALEAVASYLGLTNSNTPIPSLPKPKPQPKKDWTIERKRLEKLWGETVPGIYRLDQYFGYRGLNTPIPLSLRLHPSLSYFHQGPPIEYPCMVARIMRDGEMVGLHRTWLDPDGFGKAKCSQPKKTWKCADSMAGGTIQLFEPVPDKPLILTEGIETALAVRKLTQCPVWACVNTSMLKKVKLPENVKSIVIASDKDKGGAGERAAKGLVARLIDEEVDVKVSPPPGEIPEGQTSYDWLDYLVEKEKEEVEHAI